MADTNLLIGHAPKLDLYWMGPPSRYNKRDDVLEDLDEGDLGGRYMALPQNATPQALFDNTINLFMSLHSEGVRKYHLHGKIGVESILCQAVQMTWVFTVEENQRLQKRIDVLEEKLAAIITRLDAS